MGVAATGMHYTAMAAVEVHMDTSGPDPAGVEVFSFLFPVFILAAVALALPIIAVLTKSKRDDESALVESQNPALNAAALQ
jgi:NO-binding membrane sensor protein with MHYT domain